MDCITKGTPFGTFFKDSEKAEKTLFKIYRTKDQQYGKEVEAVGAYHVKSLTDPTPSHRNDPFYLNDCWITPSAFVYASSDFYNEHSQTPLFFCESPSHAHVTRNDVTVDAYAVKTVSDTSIHVK